MLVPTTAWLHGFRATGSVPEKRGEELLAYIPANLFSTVTDRGLHFLTNPSYRHRYYVDLTPTVVRRMLDETEETILVGGEAGGGRGIFALDISKPNVFASQPEDVVLWEFSSRDDADLGHTFSHITVVRLNNDRWAAILGNGYNDFDPAGFAEANGSGKAQLFILYLDKTAAWQKGVNYFKISTGVGDQTEAGRNGLSTPGVVDLDGDGDADRAYAGDLKGNLWAFDLSSKNSQEWGLANGGNPLFQAKNANNKLQPVMAEPMVVKNPAVDDDDTNQPNVLVLFGTGQYLVDGDKTNTDRQSFYGIADTGSLLNGATLTRAKLVEQTMEGGHPDDIRVLTAKPIDYSTQAGWFFDLPAAGERVITEATVRGRSFFYSSLIPSSDPCEYGGSGWLMVADLENGGRPLVAEFDLNGDGRINQSDYVDGPSGPGGGATKVAVSGQKYDYGLPARSSFSEKFRYTPGTKTQGGSTTKVDAMRALRQGRLSWEQLSE